MRHRYYHYVAKVYVRDNGICKLWFIRTFASIHLYRVWRDGFGFFMFRHPEYSVECSVRYAPYPPGIR